MVIRNKGYVWVDRYDDPATGKKWYTPFVRAGLKRPYKPLRLSWKTKTKAEIYGDNVYRRWFRKMMIDKEDMFHVMDKAGKGE